MERLNSKTKWKFKIPFEHDIRYMGKKLQNDQNRKKSTTKIWSWYFCTRLIENFVIFRSIVIRTKTKFNGSDIWVCDGESNSA